MFAFVLFCLDCFVCIAHVVVLFALEVPGFELGSLAFKVYGVCLG